MTINLNYEEIHEAIASLPKATKDKERSSIWLDQNKTFGVARDKSGVVEIFLFGDEIQPLTPIVQKNTDFFEWAFDGQIPRSANRIKLPKETHFEAFAAFLCLHFVEHGVFENQTKSFKESEPLIALAYERNYESIQALIGCIGELVFLRALLAASEKSNRLIDAWKGFDKSLRDFHFGNFGVEVKTSTTSSSRHHIQGVHQVEYGILSDNQIETEFYLLSIGIVSVQENESENAFTFPELVDMCIQNIKWGTSLEKDLLTNVFIEKVEKYLNSFGIEYSHRVPDHRLKFPFKWQIGFVRAYDMKDSKISLINSAKLAESSMVIPETVNFDINLPIQVNGDLNPVTGMHNFISVVLPAI